MSWKECTIHIIIIVILTLLFLRGLYDCGEEGKKLALSTFTENKSFYSCVAAVQLEKDLKLK